MKAPTTLLLLVSLVANAALVAVVASRFRSSTPTLTAPRSMTRTAHAGGEAGNSDHAVLAALASGDVNALQAAGVPADVARDLALGRALARYADVLRASRSSDTADARWWHSSGGRSAMSREQRQQFWAAQREFADAVVAAFGDDFGLFGGRSSDPQYAFLPAGKRDALRRIEQDYAEMMAEYSGGGVQLASDRERLRLLRAERERDIAALLSPSEQADYELRSSPTAAGIRARYGDAITSEDDFRKIYALQRAFDEKFPREMFTGRIAPELIQQRSAAERQLQDDLRATLGDDRYAALRRAADADLRVIDSLASRLNLPANTADLVVAARENYAVESQRLSADTSMPPPQRRAEIEKLAARAKAELAQTLGREAADAYGQRSPWVNMLQGGMAFSTNPKDAPAGALSMGGGQGVFPIMPAGSTPGGMHQVINFVGGTGPAAGTTAPFILGAPERTRVENQTISIIRTDGPAAPPASVTPPASPASPPPAPKP